MLQTILNTQVNHRKHKYVENVTVNRLPRKCTLFTEIELKQKSRISLFQLLLGMWTLGNSDFSLFTNDYESTTNNGLSVTSTF